MQWVSGSLQEVQLEILKILPVDSSGLKLSPHLLTHNKKCIEPGDAGYFVVNDTRG